MNILSVTLAPRIALDMLILVSKNIDLNPMYGTSVLAIIRLLHAFSNRKAYTSTSMRKQGCNVISKV